MPLITVILPCYNVAPYVSDAITSLKQQSLTDFEAFVIDDGSYDATITYAHSAIESDPRFHLFERPHLGLSEARNFGLSQARGDYIAFLDADDCFAPSFLAQLYDQIKGGAVSWCACALYFVDPGSRRHYHSAIHGAPRRPQGRAQRYAFDDWCAIIPHFPSVWNKLYRRDFLGDTRFTQNMWFEDHNFFQKLSAKTDHMLYLSAPLYMHRVRRHGQMTLQDNDRAFDVFDVLEKAKQIMGKDAKTALARLATRLFIERLEVMGDPVRRRRFTLAARGFFAQNGIAPDWLWDMHLDPKTAYHLRPKAFDFLRRVTSAVTL